MPWPSWRRIHRQFTAAPQQLFSAGVEIHLKKSWVFNDQPTHDENQPKAASEKKHVELYNRLFCGIFRKHRNSLGISDSLNAMWMKHIWIAMDT